MQNRTIIIGLVAATAALVAGVFLTSGNPWTVSEPVGSDDRAINVALDLYQDWLEVRQAATAEMPAQLLQLSEGAFITNALRAQLTDQIAAAPAIDPIICMDPAPEQVLGKVIYETESAAEVMVYSKAADVPQRSMMTLTRVETGWLVSGITCSNGEVAPEVEFTFDRSGNLLKDSLQPPLDNTQWHIIYAQAGQSGYAAPLQFGELSICATGEELVTCDPSTLSEAQAVTVKGNLLESGVEVVRMEFN